MPEHADDERLAWILETLDGSILGPRDLAQTVPDPAQRLVVMRLDGAVYVRDPRRRVDAHRVLRELTLDLPVLLVADEVRKVLDDVAAASHIQHLETAADREHRQVAFERRREKRALAPVALGVRTDRRRMGVGTVLLRLQVVAAGEDQPVERLEHLLDTLLVRWDEHRATAGSLDRADVVVRDERRLDLPPMPPRRRLDVGRDPDQRLGHQPRSNMRSRS